MIDDQNMKRKKYRTDQDEQFAPSDGEALTWCQAEKIQATQGKDHRDSPGYGPWNVPHMQSVLRKLPR